MARTSQSPALVAFEGTGAPRSSQLGASVAYVGKGTPRTSEIVALVAYKPPATMKTQTSQLTALSATLGAGTPRSSQIVALVAYRTNVAEDFTQRAWTFDLDGHPFYVLTLGKTGTYVYDLSTDQWHQWKTNGMPTWNMERGITWQGRVLAADNQNPLVWELDPASELDDGYKDIIRTVTGGLPARQRNFIRNDSFSITASIGDPSASPATVSLRISDDDGKTWVALEDLTVQPDDYALRLTWRSLGMIRQPGRVYEITDVGGLMRIDGVDAEVEGEG